ncbi:MAG: hypothetical protein ICV51_02470, partial [Flavisolibacter sp.]|nr:hypothetical protein [Flavisolibacter sp.]
GVNFASIARTFLSTHQWYDWVPDQSIILRGAETGENLKVAVTSATGRMVLVYFPNNSFAEIKNTLNKAATASWFDPRNGRETGAGNFQQNESRNIVPPDGWEDAILVIKAN